MPPDRINNWMPRNFALDVTEHSTPENRTCGLWKSRSIKMHCPSSAKTTAIVGISASICGAIGLIFLTFVYAGLKRSLPENCDEIGQEICDPKIKADANLVSIFAMTSLGLFFIGVIFSGTSYFLQKKVDMEKLQDLENNVTKPKLVFMDMSS